MCFHEILSFVSLELGLVFQVWALGREVRVVKVFKRLWATQTYPKFMGVPPAGGRGAMRRL